MAIITVANHLPLHKQLLHRAQKDDPHAQRGASHGPDSTAARAAERVRTRIDAIAADTMFRVNAHVQREERHDHARQRVRRRYHEHDNHLQSRCLVYVGAAQDRTCHHARDGDKAHHAANYVCDERAELGTGLGGETRGLGLTSFGLWLASGRDSAIRPRADDMPQSAMHQTREAFPSCRSFP